MVDSSIGQRHRENSSEMRYGSSPSGALLKEPLIRDTRKVCLGEVARLISSAFNKNKDRKALGQICGVLQRSLFTESRTYLMGSLGRL